MTSRGSTSEPPAFLFVVALLVCVPHVLMGGGQASTNGGRWLRRTAQAMRFVARPSARCVCGSGTVSVHWPLAAASQVDPLRSVHAHAPSPTLQSRARCKSRRFSSRRWCTAHGKSQEKKEQVPLYTSVHIVHVHLNANTTTAETSTSSALQKQPPYAAVQPHANDRPTSRMYQDMTFIPYSHAHAPLLGSAPPTRTRRSTPPPPPVVRSPHVRAHASDCAHRPPPPTPTARPRVAQRAVAYSSAGAS